MSKAIGIDFGLKRTGISISDDLRIIATPLTTVSSIVLMDFLKELLTKQSIETFVLGYPIALNGGDTNITENVRLLKSALEKEFPTLTIVLFDERFTSKIAQQTLIQTVSKKKRREKGRVDQLSATIILQDYMNTVS